MLFSIIYSVDVPGNVDIADYVPPDLCDWQETEHDDQYDYGYLEGRWDNGHYRKWCAVLDREQFDKFVEHCGLQAENIRTMGSLGAPGCGFGVAPAISFRGDDPDVIQSAYVTPLPEVRKEHGDERDWERVRGAVLAVYG